MSRGSEEAELKRKNSANLILKYRPKNKSEYIKKYHKIHNEKIEFPIFYESVQRDLAKYNGEKSVKEFFKNCEYDVFKETPMFGTYYFSYCLLYVTCKLLNLEPKSEKYKKWYKDMEEYLNS